jgi:uncharacterized membrane protein YdjX (TVP38/TMEM64 family)
MKLSRLYIAVIAVLVAAVLAAWFLWLHDVVSFQNIKAHRHELREMVGEHYVSSVAAFVGAVLCTAFFMPGALALALLGGFLFGTVHCIVYVNAGGLMGATLAFLLARHLLGNWLQQRYEHELRAFNREIKRHGHNYLVTLRILPIFPFFLVNYFAGLTRMTLRRYVLATFIGILPGSAVYSFAGQGLGSLNSPWEVLSPKILAALALMALFALLPVEVNIIKHFRQRPRGPGN